MPTRGRGLPDFDPNQSDPEDETYGAATSKPSRSHSHKSTPRKKARRRQGRKSRNGEDSEDDDISDSEIDDLISSDSSSSEEEIEIGPSGRPRRSAVKNTKPIIEDDDEEEYDDDDNGDGSGRPQHEPDEDDNDSQPSLWVKLPCLKASRQTDHRQQSHPNSNLLALTGAGIGSGRSSFGGKGINRSQDRGTRQTSVESAEHHSTDELQRDQAKAHFATEDTTQLGPTSDMEVDGDDAPGAIGSDSVKIQASRPSLPLPDLDDDDEDPISQPRRTLRRKEVEVSKPPSVAEGKSDRSVLGKRKNRGSQREANQESSDFEPGMDNAEDEEMSDDSISPEKQDDEDYTSPTERGAKRRKRNARAQAGSNDSDDQMAEDFELREELAELKPDRRSRRRAAQLGILMEESRARRRTNNRVNYDILAQSEAWAQAIEAGEDEAPAQNTPSRRGRGQGAHSRSLFSTYGPFGGGSAIPPVFGGPHGLGAVGGVDSDSSDDEVIQRPKPMGGAVGMTPTTAHLGGNLPIPFGALDPGAGTTNQAQGGTPANLGKVSKDKSALTDADPLGVDLSVTFDGVGGLQQHIDKLKEMVALPLLYPEVFQRFHVTPPRGVLFHGPPGTGKTLLARALANSVSSEGKKVTFYMRKGADALSKWVGEAERGLRTLFDDARKNQPSIIFFDEIDGLAPVRSSKQDQIHSSIVSTLLALMDGMDGRGQVIIIGATNRPDSVDPALRRPGRFDREFYFPLPNLEARRAILEIHTKSWTPPLSPIFKDDIATMTKGYGGADLRALCTEAALNAVQRRYPQIYKSNAKLQIHPETINVVAKDFMISVKKMVPSSERSTTSGSNPLPSHIEPLLREELRRLKDLVDEILPRPKQLTALQNAEYEDIHGDSGFAAERVQQEFERSRVFRPRLLLKGGHGMGQQYLASALLDYLDGVHVQAFDLPTLLSDSARSPEAAVVQLFAEVKRHKPSIIYIPHVQAWYHAVGSAVISSFRGLLRSLSPADPILLLGTVELDEEGLDENMVKDLFGVSRRHQLEVLRPDSAARQEYLKSIINYINLAPTAFPDPSNRKKRSLEILPPAPPELIKPARTLTKAEIKDQRARDRVALNHLKIRIQPVMDQIKQKYRKFRLACIDEREIRYLFDDQAAEQATQNCDERQNRPFEKAVDDHGEPGLREIANGKFYYNLDVSTIEKRLSNGYYKRPKDFTADVKKLAKDAKTCGDEERILRANEMLANVEVDMHGLEYENPIVAAEFENIYQRELKREQELIQKAASRETRQDDAILAIDSRVTSGADRDFPPASINPNHQTPPNQSRQSNLSNGHSGHISDLSDLHGHSLTDNTPASSALNGGPMESSSVPSTHAGVQSEGSFGPSAQTRPPESYTGGAASLQQRRSMPNSLTQNSATTPMAAGSQLADYSNYASTTSSDKKHNTVSSTEKESDSGPSNNTQGRLPATQYSGPDLSNFHDQQYDSSGLPDTVASSQDLLDPDSLHTISPDMPRISTQTRVTAPSTAPASTSYPTNASTHANISASAPPMTITPAVPAFNDAPPSQTADTIVDPDAMALELRSGPDSADTNLIVDKSYNEHLLGMMVERSNGCSIDQLEQLHSACMNVIWKTRADWDRISVGRRLEQTFTAEVEDIAIFQGLGHV